MHATARVERASKQEIVVTRNQKLGVCQLRVVTCRRVFFFFQAEDGIRDVAVTGVQTCALPISYGILYRRNMINATPLAPLALPPNLPPSSCFAPLLPLDAADSRAATALSPAQDRKSVV